jgi:hypothetical protein
MHQRSPWVSWLPRKNKSPGPGKTLLGVALSDQGPHGEVDVRQAFAWQLTLRLSLGRLRWPRPRSRPTQVVRPADAVGGEDESSSDRAGARPTSLTPGPTLSPADVASVAVGTLLRDVRAGESGVADANPLRANAVLAQARATVKASVALQRQHERRGGLQMATDQGRFEEMTRDRQARLAAASSAGSWAQARMAQSFSSVMAAPRRYDAPRDTPAPFVGIPPITSTGRQRRRDVATVSMSAAAAKSSPA